MDTLVGLAPQNVGYNGNVWFGALKRPVWILRWFWESLSEESSRPLTLLLEKHEWKMVAFPKVVTELGFVELVTFLRILWIQHQGRRFLVSLFPFASNKHIQDKWSQVVFLDTSWCLGLGRLVSTNSSNVENLWVSGVPMVRSREMLQVWRLGFDHSKSWLGEFPHH